MNGIAGKVSERTNWSVWLAVGLVCMATATSEAYADDAAPAPQRIALWDGKAPTGDGGVEAADAWITVHRPAKCRGTAVVICPGGGYGGLVVGPEGHGIAQWLNRHGVVGAVLEYRLPKGRPAVPLADAQRALRKVRARAADWNVDPRKVGVMGFSAGGHLASTAAVHFDDGPVESTEPPDSLERIGARPDFAILIYPVISMGELTHGGSKRNLLGDKPTAELIARYSTETQVGPSTPPTFLAHALDDKPVPPGNSRLFYEALVRHKVPAKYLELPSGGHGLDGYKGPMWDAWQKQSLEWLVEQKLLTAE